jgi:hypothetical protein
MTMSDGRLATSPTRRLPRRPPASVAELIHKPATTKAVAIWTSMAKFMLPILMKKAGHVYSCRYISIYEIKYHQMRTIVNFLKSLYTRFYGQ